MRNFISISIQKMFIFVAEIEGAGGMGEFSCEHKSYHLTALGAADALHGAMNALKGDWTNDLIDYETVVASYFMSGSSYDYYASINKVEVME